MPGRLVFSLRCASTMHMLYQTETRAVMRISFCYHHCTGLDYVSSL